MSNTAAGHIRAMLQKCCAPVLRNMRNPPDVVDDYKRGYGFLGPPLHQALIKSRNTPQSAMTNANPANISNAPITSAAQTATTARPRPITM